MESKPLFISYNHDDRKEMLAIKQALLDAGLDIWTDESLKPGTQIWADSIEKAIRNCAAVVLILTPNAVDAKWVKRELMFADEHGVKIFPVHLHGTDQETSMLAISANQKTILRAYFDKSLKKEKGKKTGKDFQKDPKWVQLLEELSQLASKPVEQTKEFKGSLFRSIPFVVSAGVILLALIALSVLGKNSLVSDLFGSPTATLTSTNTQEILVPTDTVTATVTSTPTETLTPTPSNTPTITLTPTLTPTPLPTSGDVFTNPIDESPYVFVSEGKFWMGVNTGAGDEAKPRHEVYLDAYLIGQTEVTNGMYARCVMAGACSVPANGYYGLIGYSEYPINFINWSDARTYCKWAGGDLPTEAQWEKAARGGLEGQPYPWGDTNPSCLAGTTGANYGPCGENGPVAVGSYLSNGYNLYDMAGNLWEWVRDYYNEDYYEVSPEINPQGAEEPTSPLLRVLRGGSWDDILNYLWVANRGSSSSTSETKIIGFRCVISPQLVIQSDSP